MEEKARFRAPRRWLQVSKYLLPVGMKGLGWRPTKPPREQVSAYQLACDYPERVTFYSVGAVDRLPEFYFECHAAGNRERRALAPRMAGPAFVAVLRDGISYGRHCCAIGPDDKAVRETGFNLDGLVIDARQPINPIRLQYWRKRWQGDVTSRPWLPPKQRIDGRVAILNTRFSHNFYHWMIDILPRLASIRQAELNADYYLVDSLAPFQQNVFAALGIKPQQLIQPHCRLLLEASELLVPSLPTPSCLRTFGRMLLEGLQADKPVGLSRRIFISRQRTGTRTLANEPDLERALHARGFETHYMETYPLARQARLIHEADVIVGTHGAGLANLMFARPATRVIEIVPSGRYNFTIYPEKSRVFGLEHRIVFAERARHKQILHVSISDVLEALESAERPAVAAA